MKIHIEKNSNLKISDIQMNFEKEFPFLRIEFFRKKHKSFEGSPKSDIIPGHTPLEKIISRYGTLYINENMTVCQLEKSMEDVFGLHVQVFRKSGKNYLETSVTDSWTLKKQNDVGKEISELST